MTLAKGSKITLNRDVTTTNYDTNGETKVTVSKGSVGSITGGPSPFVNKQGEFYTARFEQGHIAITLKDIQTGRTRKAKSKQQSRKSHRIVIRDASVKFFYDHTGYGYDTKKETPEQGKLRGAELLAKAEQYACDKGLIYQWQDDDCIGGDCGETATCNHPCCQGTPHVCLCCILWSADHSEVLGSLGSICEPDENYRRVVEAELALEVMQ